MIREYLIALPVEAMPLGSRYAAATQLPLHCTVMHWFLTNLPLDELLDELGEMVAGLGRSAIELVSDYPALFGPHVDVPVHVLHRNEELEWLHTALLIRLAKRYSEPSAYQWIGAGYRPHVTDRGSACFTPERVHRTDRLAVVERFADKSRVVRSEHRFPR